MGLVEQAQYVQRATREDIYFLFGEHASAQNFQYKGSLRDLNILRGQHTADQRDVKFPDSTEDGMRDLEGSLYEDFGDRRNVMYIKDWKEFEALVDEFYDGDYRKQGEDKAGEIETGKRRKWDCFVRDDGPGGVLGHDHMSSQKGCITVEPPRAVVRGSVSPTQVLARRDSPREEKEHSRSP